MCAVRAKAAAEATTAMETWHNERARERLLEKQVADATAAEQCAKEATECYQNTNALLLNQLEEYSQILHCAQIEVARVLNWRNKLLMRQLRSSAIKHKCAAVKPVEGEFANPT